MVVPVFYSGGCVMCMERPKSRFGFCERCLDALPFYGERILSEREFPAYALFGENKLSSKIIRGLKYRGEIFWADVLAEIAIDFLLARDLHRADVIAVVPISPKKRRVRGFNPPERVARAISDRLGMPLYAGLTLNRRVKDQIGLSAKERIKNVDRAFSAAPVRGRVLLIDDTYTTGATMRNCARALEEAGAREVVGLACMKASVAYAE
ncbi:MAG: phosphoribosyltransferase family protein [Peptoniphilus sp.]|nr:phosphoribosyltransferase family protein [Peptoniphilus sp.]MDD7363024.1 phosphoribosyltransferase family protein [Bacillota bacterium]MDY6045289.1 phosphoribosyltransferase family protein [Peptoniphilus sp.]